MADITVSRSEGRGRGVFAARRFEPGETIEFCPVIALFEADARTLDGTSLYDYYFGWGKDGNAAAIVLGYRSLYNRSPSPNATHQKHEGDGIMSVVAVSNACTGVRCTFSHVSAYSLPRTPAGDSPEVMGA
jgi:SET domain-containing protein